MIKPWTLALTASLLFIGATTGSAQPYNPAIDVRHYDFSIEVSDSNNIIHGRAEITILFKGNAPCFILDLAQKNKQGKGMTVSSLTEKDKAVPYTQDSAQLHVYASARSGEQHTYIITYKGIPADGLIIANNKFGRRGFFGDNWPNRAHNWIPCVDHPSDKATLDFRITAPDHYTVVANGALQEEKELPNNKKLTHWKESVPLSPKVMVIGVADFAVDHPGDAMGVPVYNYVFPENKEIGFKSYAYALQILPFYIQHIGPYPFEKCGNVQSKTRFGGLENASAIFYFENSVNSPDVEELMAHEIAHQWFGDAATETQWQHLWLSEGFATYMTHCYLENKYGIDTLKKGMAIDRKKLIAFEKKRLTPVVDTSIKDDFMKLLNPNSYEKGGWVLHMLRRRIGDDLFWKGISTYYAAYRNKNASSADFEKIMETISGQNLHAFFHEWLDKPGHPNLKVDWKYDTDDKKELLISLVQTGEQLFEFPLEYSINGVLRSVYIKDKTTIIKFPETAGAFSDMTLDPNINTLVSFDMDQTASDKDVKVKSRTFIGGTK
jgi:aminopeptidase N